MDTGVEDYVVVGKIGRPRGIDGSFYVTPITDFPERFAKMKSIYMRSRDSWSKITVTSVRYISNRPVLKIDGVDSPEEASRFTNRELAVSRDEVVELPQDTFFIFDLIDCEVFDTTDGRRLGKIVDVEKYPANDVYVVDMENGTQLRVPVVRQYVKDVDIKTRKVLVDTEGLLD